VVVSILGLGVAGIPFVTAAGIAIAAVVLIMVAASVTVLPAFLGLAGHAIDRFGLPGRRRAARGTPGSGSHDPSGHTGAVPATWPWSPSSSTS
jgi:RND superfamily putative drug exporter